MNSTPFQIKGHEHGDLSLTVSGQRDEEGCVIERITVDGSDQNLVELFSVPTIEAMAHNVDMQLAREAQQHNREVRAERHQWHREFRVAA